MYEQSSYPENAQEDYWRLAGQTQPAFPKRMIGWVAFATILIWIMLEARNPVDTVTPSLFQYSLILPAVVMIGAEFYCVLIATHRVASLLTSQHWDLLRITPQPPEKIFADLYISLQLHCWKARNIEIAARVVPFVLMILSLLQMTARSFPGMYTAIWDFVILVVLIAFVVEPYWRFFVVMATSIAIASKVRSFLLATLASIAAIGMTHILALAIIVLPCWLPLLSGDAFFSIACFLPFSLALQIAAVFWLYRQIHNRALAFAQRELFQVD